MQTPSFARARFVASRFLHVDLAQPMFFHSGVFVSPHFLCTFAKIRIMVGPMGESVSLL